MWGPRARRMHPRLYYTGFGRISNCYDLLTCCTAVDGKPNHLSQQDFEEVFNAYPLVGYNGNLKQGYVR